MLDSFSPLGSNKSEARVLKMDVVIIYLCKPDLIHKFLLQFYLYFTPFQKTWNCLIFMSWVLLYYICCRGSGECADTVIHIHITITPVCVYFSGCASQRLLTVQGWEKEKARKRTSSNQFRSPGRPHNGTTTQDAISMKGRKKRHNRANSVS